MRMTGAILLLLGVVVAIYAATMTTTVYAGGIAVQNFGLAQDRLLTFIAGCSAGVVGVMLLAIGQTRFTPRATTGEATDPSPKSSTFIVAAAVFAFITAGVAYMILKPPAATEASVDAAEDIVMTDLNAIDASGNIDAASIRP